MKLKLLLTIVCISFLAACGGVSTNPKDYFPEKVGDFTTKVPTAITQPEKEWEEKGYYATGYSSERYKAITRRYEASNGSSLNYLVTIHNEPKMAEDELKYLSDCPKPDTKYIQPYKEETLKDKTGKEIGQLLVCKSKDDFWGKADYVFTLRKGSQTLTTIKAHPLTKQSEIIEFLKVLPITKDFDLSTLDGVKAEIEKTQTITEDSLKNLAPPVQLAEKPYLKGKVYEIAMEGTRVIDDELKAKSAAEIGTIVKVDCNRSFKIGDYNASGQFVPAYARSCKVKIIDYAIPAVIAEKDFINSNIPTAMTFGTKDGKVANDSVDAPAPVGEMEKWIDSLPRN